MNGRVLLLRHGRTSRNKGGATSVDRIRGWDDVELDDFGKQEAEKMAAKLSDWPITLVVTSDLKRAVQTGKPLARMQGVKLTPTRAFRPWWLGCLQNQPSKDAQPYIERYARETPEKPVPEGESFNSFKERALPALERLLETVKETRSTVALISHYRDLKLIEGWLAAGGDKDLKVHLPTFFKDDILPGAIVELVPKAGRWAYRVLDKGAAD